MEGRVVLVTGGSRGIGKKITLRFAKTKSRLFINFFHNRTEAVKTAEEASSLGADVHLLQADLKDEEQINAMFEQIRKMYGKLDVLIHNAASGVLRPIGEITGKHWDWVLNTNARSLLLCAREAGNLMQDGGRIVSLSSIGANRVIPQYGAVGASKAALESLTRYLAVEFAPKGVSVNAISAGAVETEVWNLIPDDQRYIMSRRR